MLHECVLDIVRGNILLRLTVESRLQIEVQYLSITHEHTHTWMPLH